MNYIINFLVNHLFTIKNFKKLKKQKKQQQELSLHPPTIASLLSPANTTTGQPTPPSRCRFDHSLTLSFDTHKIGWISKGTGSRVRCWSWIASGEEKSIATETSLHTLSPLQRRKKSSISSELQR